LFTCVLYKVLFAFESEYSITTTRLRSLDYSYSSPIIRLQLLDFDNSTTATRLGLLKYDSSTSRGKARGRRRHGHPSPRGTVGKRTLPSLPLHVQAAKLTFTALSSTSRHRLSPVSQLTCVIWFTSTLSAEKKSTSHTIAGLCECPPIYARPSPRIP
jgi:hypothetical protein